MPRIVTAAVSNRLNPSIGRIRCLIRRWSCSIALFKYLQERIRTRRGKVPAAFNSATTRCELPAAALRALRGTGLLQRAQFGLDAGLIELYRKWQPTSGPGGHVSTSLGVAASIPNGFGGAAAGPPRVQPGE